MILNTLDIDSNTDLHKYQTSDVGVDILNIFKENLLILKKAFVPVFLAMVLFNTFELYLNSRLEAIIRSPEGISYLLAVFGLFSIIFSILGPIILHILTFSALNTQSDPNTKFFPFLEKNLEPMIIEDMRTWGRSLLYGLALLLPGIYKMFTYTFVPFIVAFDLDYQRGSVDALKRSAALTKKCWGRLLLVLVVFYIFIPIVLLSFFDKYNNLLKTPLQSLLLLALGSYISIWGTQILYSIYKKSSSQSTLSLDLS